MWHVMMNDAVVASFVTQPEAYDWLVAAGGFGAGYEITWTLAEI
jgi:hypothetical protein